MCKRAILRFCATTGAAIMLTATAIGATSITPTTPQYVLSWQRDNPVLAGIASAITLSTWPERYGDDATPTSSAHSQGVPIAAHGVLVNSSVTTFRVARYTSYTALGLCLVLWGWRCVRRRANQPQITATSQFSE